MASYVEQGFDGRTTQSHKRERILGEERFNYFAGDVGKAVVAAAVVVGEAFVVDAQEVKDGGVEVVDVDFVFGDFGADFVSGAIADAAFGAAAREP